MTAGETFALRRLLIGLDASAPALAALEAVASLAARLDAELVGLFVEDAALLGLAGLPVARVVDASTAMARRPGLDELEHEMRLAASRARRAMESAARRAQVRWSFRVVRGRPGPELVAAAGDADLACVSCTGWRRAPRARLGSTARELMTGSSSAVLILHDGDSLAARPVAVTSEGAEATGAIAEAIASSGSGGVVRLVPRAGQRLGEAARRAGAGCLVLTAEEARARDLDELLREAGCSILVVR